MYFKSLVFWNPALWIHYRKTEIMLSRKKEKFFNPCWTHRKNLEVFTSSLLQNVISLFSAGFPQPFCCPNVYFQSAFASGFPLPALPLCVPSSQVAAVSRDSKSLQPSCSSLWVALNQFVFHPRAADMILALFARSVYRNSLYGKTTSKRGERKPWVRSDPDECSEWLDGVGG